MSAMDAFRHHFLVPQHQPPRSISVGGCSQLRTTVLRDLCPSTRPCTSDTTASSFQAFLRSRLQLVPARPVPCQRAVLRTTCTSVTRTTTVSLARWNSLHVLGPLREILSSARPATFQRATVLGRLVPFQLSVRVLKPKTNSARTPTLFPSSRRTPSSAISTTAGAESSIISARVFPTTSHGSILGT